MLVSLKIHLYLNIRFLNLLCLLSLFQFIINKHPQLEQHTPVVDAYPLNFNSPSHHRFHTPHGPFHRVPQPVHAGIDHVWRQAGKA